AARAPAGALAGGGAGGDAAPLGGGAPAGARRPHVAAVPCTAPLGVARRSPPRRLHLLASWRGLARASRRVVPRRVHGVPPRRVGGTSPTARGRAGGGHARRRLGRVPR